MCTEHAASILSDQISITEGNKLSPNRLLSVHNKISQKLQTFTI